MAICTVCGNDYDKTMRIEYEGESYDFDCFECAIHELAPTCASCGVRVVGHGIESEGEVFCCANCAQDAGVKGAKDRV